MKKIMKFNSLVCINCKSILKREKNFLFCKKCSKKYPITEASIPIILNKKNDFYNYLFKLQGYLKR